MKTMRRFATILALAAAAACGGTEPTGGTLHLVLGGPTSVRAVQFRLAGKVITPVSAAGVRFFVDTLGVDTVMIMAVAQQGHSLSSVSIGQIDVPDVRVSYQALLLQVAAPDYSLLNPAFYSLTVTQTP